MDEKTKIPIAWLFILLTSSGSALIVAMGASFWLADLQAKVKYSEENQSDIKTIQSETSQNLRSIDQRLSRIEGALGVKK